MAMNIIEQLEKEQAAALSKKRKVPEFGPGDTLRVNVKVVEGERTRVQAYEGVCIGRAGGGLNENFTVRKISYGEGVERVFPVHSPLIESIEVMRRGRVRRAKLYYLRGRRGKAARIPERQDVRTGKKGADSLQGLHQAQGRARRSQADRRRHPRAREEAEQARPDQVRADRQSHRRRDRQARRGALAQRRHRERGLGVEVRRADGRDHRRRGARRGRGRDRRRGGRGRGQAGKGAQGQRGKPAKKPKKG